MVNFIENTRKNDFILIIFLSIFHSPP